ncbi:hypothetical protein D3C71_1895170 [compost metagenome]
MQLLGPGFDGAGLGWQVRGFTSQALPVSGLQVFEDNPPGHAVHHQVVNDQQQALRAVRQGRQHGAHQRAALQFKATLGLVAQGIEGGQIRDIGLPQHRLT